MGRVNVIETTDRWGRRVSMSQACWDLHIRRRHAEFSPHRESIVRAIEQPDYVYFDAIYASRESFYALGAVPGYERYYLKVSIEFTSEPEGEFPAGDVITAYISSNRKPKETLKWLRET